MIEDSRLWGSVEPLTARHDMALLDLDGVVYLVGEPIPGAPQTIRQLRDLGLGVRFVTNNASRSAGEVAQLLTSRNIAAQPHEVVTSAQAAAALLRDRLDPGSLVLVVGSPALAAEVQEAGLRPTSDGSQPGLKAVVQGYGPQVGWQQLADASVAVRSGLPWVATNTDKTLPSPRGPLPGNGTMVAAVATAAGREPDEVAGKPAAAALLRAVHGCQQPRPVVVGDRWDTDIAAAEAAGMPSLLVLSGVTQPADLPSIPPAARPRYLAWDISGLCEAHPAPQWSGGNMVRCRDWRATAEGPLVTLDGDGEPLDALRAIAELAWRCGDTDPGFSAGLSVTGTGDAAIQAVKSLGL
jgi:glycerol 3-phosphatase-2